jgi:hypothetical protein
MAERISSLEDGVRLAASRQADDEVDKRLTEYGFQFDPFRHLEASNDPHLFDYILTDDIPDLAWESASVLVYSPFGGGKTALRMFVTHDCWMRGGSRHPFPIHVLPQARDLTDSSLNGVWRPLVRGLSKALLLVMFYRPYRFLDLAANEWLRLLSLMTSYLPRSIPHYLSFFTPSQDNNSFIESLTKIRGVLDRSYVIPLPPDAHIFADLRRRIELHLAQVGTEGNQAVDPRQAFLELAGMVNDSLSFGEIFVLADGIDAYHREVAPLQRVATWLADVLCAVDNIDVAPVSVKGFVPQLLRPFLQSMIPGDIDCSVYDIEWSKESLVALVRRRVAVATGGGFDSLDALGDPGLRNIEEVIASTVQQQPREAIYLAGEILRSFSARRAVSSFQLTHLDVNHVINPYLDSIRIPQQW